MAECSNGHLVPEGEKLCGACGSKVPTADTSDDRPRGEGAAPEANPTSPTSGCHTPERQVRALLNNKQAREWAWSLLAAGLVMLVIVGAFTVLRGGGGSSDTRSSSETTRPLATSNSAECGAGASGALSTDIGDLRQISIAVNGDRATLTAVLAAPLPGAGAQVTTNVDFKVSGGAGASGPLYSILVSPPGVGPSAGTGYSFQVDQQGIGSLDPQVAQVAVHDNEVTANLDTSSLVDLTKPYALQVTTLAQGTRPGDFAYQEDACPLAGDAPLSSVGDGDNATTDN